MNIAIFSRVLFLSGVTTHIVDLSSELIKKGNKVFVFTSGAAQPANKANQELVNQLKEIGVVIVLIPFPRSNRNKFKYLLDIFRATPKVKKELKKNEIDIIHVHTPGISLIPVLLKRKFVKTVHIGDLSSLSILNRKATHEITISRETYKISKSKFGYKNEDISLIFNGVNSKFASLASENEIISIKKNKSIPLNKIIIGLVGSIEYRKGHDILINAIYKLPVDLKGRIHLLILGDGNTEWLQTLLKEHNLSEKTSVFSFQNPKPFYDIIDIFVLPSRLEGFPLVSLEAFLSGCCVVRSNVEGAYDQINDNETGFIFESEDSKHLSKILEKLILDKNFRESVADRGRQFALENFTSEIMAKKTLDVYQKVIDSK